MGGGGLPLGVRTVVRKFVLAISNVVWFCCLVVLRFLLVKIWFCDSVARAGRVLVLGSLVSGRRLVLHGQLCLLLGYRIGNRYSCLS